MRILNRTPHELHLAVSHDEADVLAYALSTADYSQAPPDAMRAALVETMGELLVEALCQACAEAARVQAPLAARQAPAENVASTVQLLSVDLATHDQAATGD